MSFLSRILGNGTNKPTENRDSSQVNANGLFSAAWSMLTNTQPTASGELVNEIIALQHVSVYASVRVIAESVGTLTPRLYEQLPKGRREAFENPIHRMLTVAINDEMCAPVVWESIAGCMALTGNSYLEILRNKDDFPVGLYPLNPTMTEPVRLPNGKLAYQTTVGQTNGQKRTIAAADMLHFPLFSFDGLKGLSPIAQARQTIGLARATEKFGAKFFGNGSRPGGILTPKGELDEKQAANMREFWERANSGENQNRTAVLPSDWEYQALGLSPEESQFLETRQMTRTDIAALFRVPAYLIGDTSRLSNSNHEQMMLQFATGTLRPYLVRIEREISRKLLPADGSLRVEFDTSELLRGDFKSTMDGLGVARQWGFINQNEGRQKLNMNPVEGGDGDVYWAPFQFQNAKNLIAVQTTESTPDTEPIEPAPTPAQRSLFASYIPVMSGLFSDAVGRVISRSKRDVETLTPILWPVLDSIASLVITEARAQFRLADDWQPSGKVTADYLKGVASRAADWTPETREQIIGAELTKAIRAIHIGIYREAGGAIALKDTQHE